MRAVSTALINFHNDGRSLDLSCVVDSRFIITGDCEILYSAEMRKAGILLWIACAFNFSPFVTFRLACWTIRCCCWWSTRRFSLKRSKSRLQRSPNRMATTDSAETWNYSWKVIVNININIDKDQERGRYISFAVRKSESTHHRDHKLNILTRKSAELAIID